MSEEKELSEPQKEINGLVDRAQKALADFANYDQEKIDYIVAKASIAALDQHGYLAKLAVEETKRGVLEDKATKNLFACEYVVNHMRHLKTVGVIEDNDVTGIIKIAEPVGVVAGLTPVTNPTSTAIFKSLICLKTRNPIIFSFHPSAIKCSIAAAKIVYDAAVAAGAPKNCIQWIEEPSMEKTDLLIHNDGVATILATGGNAMVRAAYSCGKPALGVGAGNVPAYVEKSCDIKQAINDIVLSKSFDNGMICASEQGAIIDKEIYNDAIKMFKEYRAYLCNEDEKKKLEKYMFGVDGDPSVAKLNAVVPGMNPVVLAKNAGFDIPERTSIILVECKEVGVNEPMTREKLSPVLAVLKASNTDDGLKKAKQFLEFGGLGHSAAIHTKNKELAEKFGDLVPAIRVIWNSPSTFGGIGNVYNSFIPSLTFGCGSYGHNSTDDNVSAINLLNVKKLGRRRNNMQWFKIPSKIFFERDSIEYLHQMKGIHKAIIVTDRSMVQLGFVDKITDQLKLRREPVQLFCDVEPDPSIQTVREGVELMRSFEPDTIIALGGGSSMDCAKGMWLFYENPDVDFNDLKQKFMDIRKRAFRYPSLGQKASLVCIPTTSGTGSEVTPFAVITDKVEHKKYPLTDYSLTPTIAIVDPTFTYSLPPKIIADTGMDVLTHATEAYVSTLANDYTDGLCIQAIKMVFKYLERSYKAGFKDAERDDEAKEKMHNASCLAGMAFANAFLGMNHSMAHKVGAEFHVPHGRANAILLPFTIRYNGTQPDKLSTWPKYNYYKAAERYCELARMLGLPAKTVEEGVESYAKACGELGMRLGIQMNFKSQNLDEKEYLAQVDKLAFLAYEDQCSPANPRVPMIEDMKKILTDAYYTEEFVAKN